MAAKNGKGLYFVALGLFLAGIGYLAVTGFSEGSSYFVNVSEALSMSPEKLDAARLFGTVQDGDITRLGGGPGVRFHLEDKDDRTKTIQVVYAGAVPDTFKAGAEVIVEGRLEQNEFKARTLMTKCPSKYQKENRV